MLRTVLVLTITLTHFSAGAVTLLVPVFDEHLAGANKSIWQTELRIYNPSDASATVATSAVYPYGNARCTGFAPVTVAPGAMVQLRSIGCPDGGAAALELTADDTLDVTAVTTNVAASAKQDTFCCLNGFTEQVPVLPASTAYATTQTIAQMQVPALHSFDPLGRHNLGIINPNDTPLAIHVTFYDADGNVTPVSLLLTTSIVTAAPRTMVQLNDVIPQAQGPFESPTLRGYFRVQVVADQKFYAYDSYVDNVTNDATFLAPTAPPR